MCNMFWWDLKSSKSKEPFKFHSPYSLLICSISACLQHQYLLSCLNFLCISFDLQKERTKERKKKERAVIEVTFYEKTLNHKSNPRTSTSSALPAHRIYFFSTQISTPFRKLSTKNTLHSIAFLFCFNLFQISLQFLYVKIMEKYGMRSQDVVDIMHWNCLAW